MFRKVAIGGTFDHLHLGHLALIRKAFEIGERVLIGVCGDSMVKGRADQPFAVRKLKLEEFLQRSGWRGRYELVELKDPFGPAVADRELEAIVVSPETESRAVQLNLLRKKRGLEPLVIVRIPWVLSEDGKPISSTRIRAGEIDESGRLKEKPPYVDEG